MRSFTLLVLLATLAACTPASRFEVDVDGGQPDAAKACKVSSTRYDLNDVSFLFPLPETIDGGELLDLSTPRAKGPLLPPSLVAMLPEPTKLVNSSLADLKVVAVRVDPCFPTRSGSGCIPQVRLVAQPLAIVGQPPELSTVDTAVHLFYEITSAELNGDLRARLDGLKRLAGTRTSCQPLRVHPVMVDEGLGGSYAQELRALVTQLCGATNLSRVAAMTLTRPGTSWEFEAFDLVNGQLVADPIPRLMNVVVQAFGISDILPLIGRIVPAPASGVLPMLLDETMLAAAGDEAVRGAVDETFRIENPALESPRTIDCVSCHVAGRGREEATTTRGITGTGSTTAYSNTSFDLSPAPNSFGFGSQRAFGYFHREPSLTARTINESAEVATFFGSVKSP